MWDRWELGKKSIFYDEDIRGTAIPAALYPTHVEALRRCMLDFSCATLGSQDEAGVELDLARAHHGNPGADPTLAAAHKTLNKATTIHQGGYSEKRWEAFFHAQFFEPLAYGVSVSKGDPRRVSRCNYYYDAFRAETNELWDLFSGGADELSDLSGFERIKCPKPDHAFYLPIYHLDAEPRIPRISEPEGRQWNQALGHPIVDSFSWSTLKELFAFGLRPTPFRVFHKPPVEAGLNCYPWLLVEHKKESASEAEKTASCQAANGGACAIKLNQITARYAVELPDDAHIPPIPTVTTVGSHVKIWIMYFAKDFHAPCSAHYWHDVTWKRRKRGYVMRAIWEGDMTKLVDIIKFQMILENTHTWAMRVFKPLMSSYIDQWKHVHSHSGISTAKEALSRRQETIEQCRAIVPMVQSVLDSHSTLELNDSKHIHVTPLLLGLLVQQICSSERQVLAGEVDRIVAERLKALNLRSEESFPQRTTIETQDRSQRRRTSVASDQSSLPSPGPTVDNDDPDDGDYEGSQATWAFSAHQLVAETSSDESEFRRRTRSNPQRVLTPTALPYRPSPVADVPGTPDAYSGGSTSLSGSPTMGTSDTSPPGPARSTDRFSFNSPIRAGGSTRKLAKSPRQPPSPGASKGKIPSVLFAPTSSKWPPGKLFPQWPSSPAPPTMDITKWKLASGPLDKQSPKPRRSTESDGGSEKMSSPDPMDDSRES
ncbi:hypothetical protein FZEAL_8074 [Fusarium zealandicum]|uniref:Uncharacterized protein n=1 Tax=Fusarium zealandicum TaxID=1053134 RepID=A0A8H4UEU2_9HYPO|nr:hypothetical protein FZEAL_8074 [Fusarium zealandicum]